MKRNRGFVLIDLHAVIAMIAILLALLIPLLKRARESARRAKCAAHLKHVGMAFAQYLSEYGSYAPSCGGVIQFGWGKGKGWMDKLFIYVDAGPLGEGPSYPDSAESERTKMFRCPSITKSAVTGDKYLSSYILNSRLWMDSPRAKFYVARLKHPVKVIVLYDRNKWTGAPDDADMTDEWGNSEISWADTYGPGGLWYYPSGGPDFPGPHKIQLRGYNILFADWHVAWFGRWDRDRMTRHAEQ